MILSLINPKPKKREEDEELSVPSTPVFEPFGIRRSSLECHLITCIQMLTHVPGFFQALAKSKSKFGQLLASVPSNPARFFPKVLSFLNEIQSERKLDSVGSVERDMFLILNTIQQKDPTIFEEYFGIRVFDSRIGANIEFDEPRGKRVNSETYSRYAFIVEKDSDSFTESQFNCFYMLSNGILDITTEIFLPGKYFMVQRDPTQNKSPLHLTIYIELKKYRLISSSFLEGYNRGGIPHYTAYVYNQQNGKWYYHDDQNYSSYTDTPEQLKKFDFNNPSLFSIYELMDTKKDLENRFLLQKKETTNNSFSALLYALLYLRGIPTVLGNKNCSLDITKLLNECYKKKDGVEFFVKYYIDNKVGSQDDNPMQIFEKTMRYIQKQAVLDVKIFSKTDADYLNNLSGHPINFCSFFHQIRYNNPNTESFLSFVCKFPNYPTKEDKGKYCFSVYVFAELEYANDSKISHPPLYIEADQNIISTKYNSISQTYYLTAVIIENFENGLIKGYTTLLFDFETKKSFLFGNNNKKEIPDYEIFVQTINEDTSKSRAKYLIYSEISSKMY